MDSGKLRRIRKEIEAVQKDSDANIELWLVSDSDFYHMKARFLGPVNTPYEGGHFQVDIVLNDVYPFAPPKMKFDTPVYHPNISSQTGAICLDILKNQWTPVLTLKSALISLQSLLSTPEPRDPQDAQVAAHYLRDQADFAQTAQYWTEVYADDPRKKEGEGKQPRPPVATVKEERGKEEVVTEEEKLPEGITKEAVKDLVNMGFEKKVVVRVLTRTGGDVQAAVERLLSGGV